MVNHPVGTEKGEEVMRLLFNPSSVVVIGVSTRWNNLGKEIARNLLEFNYNGVIHLVGLESGVIFGHKIHHSLDEIDDPIDLAVILTPSKTVPSVLEQVGKRGIKRAVIESGGFGEFDNRGTQLEDELRTIAKKYDMRFIGPNCVGIMNSANGLTTPFMPMKNVFRRGGISIIAQSGGVGLSLLNMFDGEQLGWSKWASIGNKLSIDENDVLEYFIEDPETTVVCLYLESIVDGRRLTEIAKRSTKPIVVHKANIGSLSRVIAQSHTAALANDDRVVDAALRQAGMVRFSDMQGYVDFVKVLQLPRMKEKNLAIVSRSGGHAVMAADAALTYGFNLPPFRPEFLDGIRKHLRADVIRLTNPLDLGDLFDFDVYMRLLEDTVQQETVDGVLFLQTYASGTEGENSRGLLKAVAKLPEKYGKPVAICVSTEQTEMSRIQKEFDFPIFRSPEQAVEALDEAMRYERRRASIARSHEEPELMPAPDDRSVQQLLGQSRELGRSPLLHEALAIIQSIGINVPPYTIVRDLDRLDSDTDALTGPYAAKIVAREVSHKSDSGGVLLNLHDKRALRDACAHLMKEFGDADNFGTYGVLVQQMAPRVQGSYELIIGGKRDPQFGPVVLVGPCGILVEVFAKSSIRMAPLSMEEIDEMIEELPGSEILKGVRGRPAIDREALRQAILRLAYLMVYFPEIDQIDVNPILVSSKGALAVDARIVLGADYAT